MSTFRFAVWVALSACLLAIALVLVAVTRSIASLDHGWLNALVILAVWSGVAMALKNVLGSDAGQDSATLRHRAMASTLRR